MKSNLSHAIETRRGEVDRIRDSGAQWFKISGEVTVYGAGESVVSVTFPVFFTEEPRGSFFGRLYPGSVVEEGNLPTVSLVATDWGETQRDDGTVLIGGATFAIVTSGAEGQGMVVQWHMEGVGIRGPVDE